MLEAYRIAAAMAVAEIEKAGPHDRVYLAVRSEVGPPDRARLVVGEEKPGPVSREPARLCQGRLPSLVIVQCLNAAPGPGAYNTGGQVEAVDLVRTGHGDEE